MTVTYTAQVATSRGFGCFWKLLFRWRGSIYKLVWHELVVYCLVYSICSVIYRIGLSEDRKRVFEAVAMHIEDFINLIPMAFVLGFYISIVVKRWWDQYITLPWPDTIAVFVSTNIHGQNEKARVMRRTILRYVNLTFCITLSMISPAIKKRFPTMGHMVEMGLLTEQEQMIFEILNARSSYAKYWMPLVWAGAVVSKARKEGRIRDDFAVKTIMDEINNFRRGCGRLLSYDKISVPLVYTQVVTLSVYTFFISTIVGRQFLDPEQKLPGHTVDLYIPWFTLLQFFFYMGWLKVAETLINPFGEDDDDFEVNSLIDRNIVVSYLIVDEMHSDHPELIKDMYYDEVVPQALPYTVAAEQYKVDPNQGSTANIVVPEHEQEILETVPEEEDELETAQPEAELTTSDTKDDLRKVSVDPRSSSVSRKGSAAAPSRRPSLLTSMINRITSATTRKQSATGRVQSSSSLSKRREERSAQDLQRRRSSATKMPSSETVLSNMSDEVKSEVPDPTAVQFDQLMQTLDKALEGVDDVSIDDPDRPKTAGKDEKKEE